MITGINALSSYGINTKKFRIKNAEKQNNITFRSLPMKQTRNVSLALAAAACLSLYSSCHKGNNKEQIEEQSNSISIVNNNTSHKVYHYFPTEDGSVRPEDYSWSETFFPDGRIEKDSMGYKIFIDPQGQRMTIKTEQDATGNLTVIKQFPDGTKYVRTDYQKDKINEVLYVETDYWSNGKMKERHYYNSYPSDINELYGEKTVEESLYKYNENGVLLSWESNQTDPERSSSNNKYDKKGRLIYDDLKEEKYEYKHNSKTPYRAIRVLDGCQRIKIHNADGSIKREYFKAQDGTITECQFK